MQGILRRNTMKHNSSIDPIGTFAIGYFRATYQELKDLLGTPAFDESDKVSTEWRVEFKEQTFTIYDYKMTNSYNPNYPTAEILRKCPDAILWHVGSNKHENLTQFCSHLSKLLFVQFTEGKNKNVSYKPK